MLIEEKLKFKIIIVLISFFLLFTQCFFVSGSYNNFKTNSVKIIERTDNFQNTLYVGGSGSGNYSTIQDAVLNSTSGDTIFVYNGTYYENVVINKQIYLLGENQDSTIIDGSNSGNVIKITSDNVSVSDFTIQHGGIGIYILYSSNENIFNNNIRDNWEGIGLFQTTDSIISNNIIYSNFFEGINPIDSSSNIISKNIISGNLQGIFFSESDSNIIHNNDIYSNTRGIELRSSSNDNQIYHNNFLNNIQDNAFDDCSNIWDNGYPSGGNYWDDYNGVDNDGDGIGDTPYSIAGGSNEDYYPFMNQYGWNLPPYSPSNPNPINGSIEVDINADLYWSGGDPDSDPVNYDIYFGINNPPNKIISNHSFTTYSPGLMNNNTKYYWKIVAWDCLGASNESPIWCFTTIDSQNAPPNIPSTPYGATFGNINIIYNFSTLSTDPDNDNLSYGWDWDGDLNIDEWSDWYKSGENCTISHLWNIAGIYFIRVKARDIHYSESDWSPPLIINISNDNNPPNPPNIRGPPNGQVGIKYEYNFSLFDYDNDLLYLRVDWGSGLFGPWIGPFESNSTIKLSHTWNEKGSFNIRAQIKDIYNFESEISEFEITMPKNDLLNKNIFLLEFLKNVYFILYK